MHLIKKCDVYDIKRIIFREFYNLNIPNEVHLHSEAFLRFFFLFYTLNRIFVYCSRIIRRHFLGNVLGTFTISLILDR